MRDILALVVSGRVGVLIIEDIDRLSRDAEHLRYMVKLFRLRRWRCTRWYLRAKLTV
ncbi:hypothetical protein NF701_12365 [Sphingomonadaceae bacterium OTU29THOMA1]|nr:hypothetical protein NF701_12365 [Sphingomonadaceae bacterium OTU29THOMA1]